MDSSYYVSAASPNQGQFVQVNGQFGQNATVVAQNVGAQSPGQHIIFVQSAVSPNPVTENQLVADANSVGAASGTSPYQAQYIQPIQNAAVQQQNFGHRIGNQSHVLLQPDMSPNPVNRHLSGTDSMWIAPPNSEGDHIAVTAASPVFDLDITPGQQSNPASAQSVDPDVDFLEQLLKD